jgi:predicted phosphodiesterase
MKAAPNFVKYAIMGDIHGNWEALSAVLEDAAKQNVTAFICVGDLVGYNANPRECLSKVRELNATVVRGNHDHYSSYDESLDDFHPLAAHVIDWTRKQLSDDDIRYLRELKLTRVVSGFTIVHSTLDMPEKWGYVFDTLEADANFAYQSTSVCFHGHTHIPVVFEKAGRVARLAPGKFNVALGKKYFINVGSVGQPRDGDPRAAYVTFNMKDKEVELRRIEYDIECTQKKILRAGLPERLAIRLGLGK